MSDSVPAPSGPARPAECGGAHGLPILFVFGHKGPFKNFRYRTEIKINDDGYEAQIDCTHRDPIRTGSLYGFCHVYKQLVKPDTWFTYELEVRDDVWCGRQMTRIKITVDGNELYECLDFAQTFKERHFAFQQHDPGSEVSIRKVQVMPLAD